MQEFSKEELKKRLTEEQYHVVCEHGTEKPFENEYWNNKRDGIYVDRVSNEPLFLSIDKFDSGTGWPSFVRPIKPDVVKENEDKSLGRIRTELTSTSSQSHLGHFFPDGPKLTGLRYCINSAALKFIPVEEFEKEDLGDYLHLFPSYLKSKAKKLERAVFAAGCFWGVEAYFRRVKGVVGTRTGYCGGTVLNPTYEDVCTGKTGHAEAVEIEFDGAVITYEKLLAHFFKIHDPTSLNRQGGDVGTQYRSAIFCVSDDQEKVAKEYIKNLKGNIVTEIKKLTSFFEAEEYHQDYLEKNPDGYCHVDLSCFRKGG